MAKDPAVLFYTSDFLSGCIDLDMEERGQYITLLCAQHQKGRLSEKTIRLLVGSVSVSVLSKFQQDSEGNFYNARMELETIKRSAFVESRHENGSKGGRPKKSKANGKANNNLMVLHMDNHMGNENDNENEIVNGNKVGGMGEGKKHDSEPTPLETQNTIEYIHRLKAIMLTPQQVSDYWPAFKTQMQTFYPSRKDVIRHFQNWLKNNVKNGSSNHKPTRSDEYAEAYRRLVGE